MKVEKSKTKKKHQFGNISINELMRAMLSKWYLFVIALTCAVGYSLYVTSRIEPTYTRNTQILIKSSKKGNSIDEQMETFANMGFRSSTNAYNEIYIFKAPETTIETARRLNLNVEYSKKGEYYPITLYGRTVPVFVEFRDINTQDKAGFCLEIKPDSTFTLSNFKGNTITEQRSIKGKLTNDSTFVATPVGTVVLSCNPAYTIRKSESYNVSHIGLHNAAAKHIGKLGYNLDGEDNNLITITINDNSIERADDILRTIVDVYNENWIKDKNKAAQETKNFIDTRLGYVSSELDKIESDISAFKSDNLLPDIEAQSEIQLTRERELEKQRNNIQKELEKSEYFLKVVKDKSNAHTLLPLNSGINNTNINSQIGEYNRLMIERNNLASRSSEDNPAVKDIDLTLSSMRSAIISSVNTHIKSITTKSQSIEKEWKNLQSEIAKNPTHTTFLASAEREQSVKENIYLFLLQKREENQLSQEFTPNRIRILAPPSGSYEPTAPQKTRSLIFYTILGLALPAILICLIEVSNTRIRGRKDLDSLTAPIIGEVPQNDRKRARLLRRILSKFNILGKKKDHKSSRVVKEGSRNAINEAFRVLRTNIEFITRENEQNVIIFTSFNPGSGKTFCILNTAISFALKGEKVLLIDGDMRHASLSEHASSNEIGLSNYLAKEVHSLREIITTDETHPALHIIPTGTVPPNPTELLESERLEILLNEAKKEYRYIFIDCPPVDIVADTHIIEKYATNSLFLVRCDLLQRSMIAEIENLYTENKLKKMSVILNGIDMKAGKYGYKYGYNSGGKYSYGPKKNKRR
ncbi:MAG: polysaccharide biosynthesis tyrosine autokinase [Bacteroidaceae bacterium]|nr:polysaccharide biosynthesis tyrosine autokinase [Bacteroidaceae bacterium]